MAHFDLLVLTAANETQAAGYRAQLDWRKDAGMLAPETRTLVLPDPGGRRVGSLGATLAAIRDCGIDDWSCRRVFICHSGGDSKRTPAYAARGKVFTPVPCRDASGHPLAVLDLILSNAEKLPRQPGILVASGDVVLTFGDADLNAFSFAPSGVTGIGYYDSMAQGSRHGVYVADAATRDVRDFLQKPDEATARAAGAVSASGQVAVDTGLVFLAPDVCQALQALSRSGIVEDLAAGTAPQMDLYEEFLMALVPSIGRDRYLRRFASRCTSSKGHQERLAALHSLFSQFRLQCNIARKCDFFHIGSSAELLAGFTADCLTARLYGFAKEQVVPGAPAAFVFNSRIGKISAEGPALIEGCIWSGALNLAGDNIVTGLHDAQSSASPADIALPRGIGLVALPVGERDWAVVAYGVKDDFKTAFSTSPSEKHCLFLGEPVEKWLEAKRLAPSDLWGGDEALGMWSARLWRAGTLEQALRDASDAISAAPATPGYKAGARLSISQLIPLVNHARAIAPAT